MASRELEDRFRGALLGTAIGDALGAPFEGSPQVAPAALAAVEEADEVLRWTDDTHMTIGVAESLSVRGRFDGADMAQRFVALHAAEPWRGYGPGPPEVFAAIRAGARWDQPARRLFGGTGSYGNGGAMRAAPAGLFRHRDLEAAVRLARSCAAITHTHELGLQGAALQGAAVAWVTRAGDEAAVRGTIVDAVRPAAPANRFQAQLDTVAALATAAPAEAARRIGSGISAVEAVPAALWAFLRHPASYADTVRAAILLGGDTDTIAAMAGALSGAFLGARAIPAAWRRRLEAEDPLSRLADDLCAAAA